jgi:glycosyltransferase involved in cell wall biosynthesis
VKIAIASKDLIPQRVRRQPWFYLNALAEGLMAAGHETWMLTGQAGEWPDRRQTLVYPRFRSFPGGVDPGLGELLGRQGIEAVIWSTGISDFCVRNKVGNLGIPVIAVATAPRYTIRELLGMARDFWDKSRFFRHLVIAPLATPRKIKQFLNFPNLKAMVFQSRESLRRFVPEGGDRGKTIIIPPPLPENFYQDLKGLGVAGESSQSRRFTVLYCGPPLAIRGVDTVVAAMARVAKQATDVRLEILSRTDFSYLLDKTSRLQERMRRAGLEGKAEVVTGVLSPREVARRLGEADVICLPFKGVVSDAPIIALEALASGTPLITTPMAGLSDFAQDGDCLLTPPGDAGSLAEAILSIYRRGPGAKSDKKGNQALLFQHHGQTAFAAAWEKLLKAVL